MRWDDGKGWDDGGSMDGEFPSTQPLARFPSHG